MANSKKAAEIILTFALFAIVVSSAIPKPADGEKDGHHNRVHEKDLSDQKHFDDDENHNSDYDHEAFLGDDYKTFDDLTPEESKERLAIIYDKIDKDGDGFVTEHELKEWIQHVQNKYIEEDTARQWADHETTGDALSWETYKKRTYGFMNDEEEENVIDEDGGYSYKDMLRRDERRWKKADQDGDGSLTKKEFQDFLHPEDTEHMRDIVIDETIEDIDKDGDGLISLEEYIEDFYDAEDEDDPDFEPEWIQEEKREFSESRDKNGDGFLDKAEVKEWILPEDTEYIQEETVHLISEADSNKDNMLTKEEVLEKYDLFVGSQATDFGEALTRHDEF